MKHYTEEVAPIEKKKKKESKKSKKSVVTKSDYGLTENAKIIME